MFGAGPRSSMGAEETVLTKARMAKMLYCLKFKSMVVISREVLDARD